MKAKADLIIFDNDGTLFNSRKGVLQAVKSACIKFKRERQIPMAIPSLERIAHLTGNPADEFFPALLPDGFRHLAGELRELSLAEETEAILREGELFEGVTDVITRLKSARKKLAIVTNAGGTYIRTVGRKFNYENYFHLVASPEINGFKGKVELVRYVINELGGGDTALVGDKFADMFAAKQNRATAIFAAYGFGNEEDAILADFAISSPLEILNFLV